jgi:hypothetical protein
LSNCNTKEHLMELKDSLPVYVVTHEDFKKAGMKRYNEISSPVNAQ